MIYDLTNSILKKYGLKKNECIFQNKQIPFAEFNKVHDFPNSIIIVKEVVIYGHTDTAMLQTGKFVVAESQGQTIDLTPTFKFQHYRRLNGSNIFVQLLSDFIFEAHTRINFKIDNTLFDTIYNGYANYIEIEKKQ